MLATAAAAAAHLSIKLGKSEMQAQISWLIRVVGTNSVVSLLLLLLLLLCFLKFTRLEVSPRGAQQNH